MIGGGVRIDLDRIRYGSDLDYAFCHPPVLAGMETPAEAENASDILTSNGGGRHQYKTVAGPVGLTIERSESYAAAVRKYATIIDREAVDGWKLDSIQEIPVTKKSRLFGKSLRTSGCYSVF